MKLFKNVRVILPDKVVAGLVLFSDKIQRVIKVDNDDEDELINKYENLHNDLEVIAGQGRYLAPGFIDIHVHGSAGADSMDACPEALDEIKSSLIKTGVTSFLPTTTTMSGEKIRSALGVIKQQMQKKDKTARMIGVHLEGPFINCEYRGAQNPGHIADPDTDLIADYKDIIELVTLAPEVEGAKKLIVYLQENGIVASAGHTGAGYDDIIRARQWGLKHVTHLFNAMTGLHHRRPGVVGAALASDLSCELIADLIHIHPAVINIVLQAKSLDRIILVTDQIRAGTLQAGRYDLGGQEVTVKNGEARLENGDLAGSVLTLDQAVRNIWKISSLELFDIIKMVSLNPARLLEKEDKIGQIAKGNRADFVLLDEELEVSAVYKKGNRCKW